VYRKNLKTVDFLSDKFNATTDISDINLRILFKKSWKIEWPEF
jgi:hypothetical protein